MKFLCSQSNIRPIIEVKKKLKILAPCFRQFEIDTAIQFTNPLMGKTTSALKTNKRRKLDTNPINLIPKAIKCKANE